MRYKISNKAVLAALLLYGGVFHMEKLLELKDVAKSYSGVEVLRGVNLLLKKGEVVCLVGENGAGKSTLIKIISGAIAPDRGTRIYFGKVYDKVHPRQVIDMGIATIYQEIDLIDNISVADNIFLGSEIKTKFGFIDGKKQEDQANKLLDELKLTHIRGSMLVKQLSTAQKQCVQIVKALKNKARVLILDEPTASLGDQETKLLLELVKKLSNAGIGIIYISHYIDELFEVGDTFLILKDGEQTALRKKIETNPEEVIRDMIGRDASSFYKREYFQSGKRTLEIKNYENEKTVYNVSFKIKSGEIFGLGGLVGAGRTELVRMLYGADTKKGGELYIDGKLVSIKNPKEAIEKGIFMISEDRKGEGLLGIRSVKENVMLTHNERREWIHLSQEEERVNKAIELFNIKTAGMDAEVFSLSGGNQQKAIIARCVEDMGEVYIFDEPTKGVDVGAKEEIYGYIVNLAKQDKFIILISSDMPELLSMSDRIGIMREGHLVDVVNTKEVNEEILMREYLGVK